MDFVLDRQFCFYINYYRSYGAWADCADSDIALYIYVPKL